MKAMNSKSVINFKDIPNIGPAMVRDFKILGINIPKDLTKQNPHEMYQKLCRKTETRHDPCVLDTFIAAVDFMRGAPPRPWWFYTKERKKKYPNI